MWDSTLPRVEPRDGMASSGTSPSISLRFKGIGPVVLVSLVLLEDLDSLNIYMSAVGLMKTRCPRHPSLFMILTIGGGLVAGGESSFELMVNCSPLRDTPRLLKGAFSDSSNNGFGG